MPRPDPDVLNRRQLLSRGLAGALGAVLARQSLLSTAWAAPGAQPARACVFLWLDGGPSQLETFDPKPGTKTGGPTRAIATRVQGLRFAEHLPQLARRAHRLAVVRSMTSKEGEHERARYLLHTGYARSATVQYPTLGSMLSAEKEDAPKSVPTFVALGPDPVGPGYLGSGHAAYVAEGGVGLLEQRLDGARLRRRLKLLEQVEEPFARAAALQPGQGKRGSARTAMSRSALEILEGPLRDALDLDQASRDLRVAYGASELGDRVLRASRLVQAGVRCVEVTIEGWDDHEGIFRRLPARVRRLDRAFAALVDDLARRKLLESTLIVCMGEFGRTPRINREGGRDHYPFAFSAVLAGGGIKPGVVGATSPDGRRVVDRPVSVPDLFATVLTRMGIDPTTERYANDRPLKLVNDGKAVGSLLPG